MKNSQESKQQPDLAGLELVLAKVDFNKAMRRYCDIIVPNLRWSETPSPSRSLIPYHHPNGFLLIPLPLSVTGQEGPYRFRLHVWPAGQDAIEDAHSHAWSFASRLIGGAISYEIYEECSIGQSSIRRRRFTFQLDSTGRHSLDQSPLVGLRVLTCGTMERHSHYALRGDVIHATRQNARSWACTMVCIAPNERDFSVVYLDESKSRSVVRVEKVPLTPSELKVALEAVADLAIRP
jgi:hypothetical protein